MCCEGLRAGLALWFQNPAELAEAEAIVRGDPYRASGVTTAALNVRAGPGTWAAIVGGLPAGTAVEMWIRSPDFEWWLIESGWVNAGWVRREG